MKSLIEKTPVPIAGLMLALAATGNLLLSYGDIYRNIFGVVASLILVLLIFKIFFDTKSVVESFKNPVVASVMITFTMGLMILATYIVPYAHSISFGVWSFGLLLHCFLLICFTAKFIFNFDIKKVFPSYFVVYVGIVVASMTAPTDNLISLGKGIFWFGLISYLLLLPIVIYRTFFIKGIQEQALPTISIFAAPASLCLAGYLACFTVKNNFILGFLGGLAFIMFLVVILYLPKLLKTKFYPSYSAFTFPMVISAVAMKQLNGYLVNIKEPIYMLKYLVKFQEVLAVLIVIYVLARYFKFLFLEDKISKNSKIDEAI
ncbi:TDT family transporter [Clostridium sp. CF011]|uniref:TDT family transporter n=1 Tax=Clostridium sp. CF011 TaxID=2843318 RepID=UPI001C0B9346|nr:TDT family transporter [Clostridium sp. CF011]MBU3093000.1 TDT family transporter [Clostridium sp. CF011]WAG70945.1 TDT family transporter [Clostridium sp. CF011]